MLMLIHEGLKDNKTISYTIYPIVLVQLFGLFYFIYLNQPKLIW